MPRRRDGWVGALSFALLLVGCVRLDKDHCANRGGDASCAERGDALLVCSECVADNDGCIAGPVDAECHAAGTTGGSESGSVADDNATQDPIDDPSISTSPVSAGEGSVGEESTTLTTSALDDTSTSQDDTNDDSNDDTNDDTTTDVSDSSAADESSTTAIEPECGNGIREADEECDFPDLDGETCLSLPETAAGTLGCDQFCNFNTSECTECVLLAGICAVDEQCCTGHCNLGLCIL